jgi:molybdenum cofactor biosynthesis protein B
MSETSRQHKAAAPKKLNILEVTCSTSKYNDKMLGKPIDDVSGDMIERLMKEAGHEISRRILISDNEAMIKQTIREASVSPNVDAVILTGGTGIAPKDVTIEAVKELLDKALPGFGELFRKISYDSIGSAALMSRALAGVTRGKAIFCLPGSPDAVEKALKNLIIPEIGHIVKHSRD